MGAAALPLVVRPIIGESGLSLLSRLADVNGVDLVTVLRDVGDLRRHDAWDDQHWQRLARRIALPVSQLEPLRRRPAMIATAPAAIRFMGKAVHPQYIVTNRLRICPVCVGEQRMLKEAWRLVYGVACADHGSLLVDTCRCGRPFDLRARGADPFTCVCGLAFEENHVSAASPTILQGSLRLNLAFGAVATATPSHLLAKNGRLDLPLSAMEPFDLMAAIDIIGQAATTPAEADEHVPPGKRWRRGDLSNRRDLPTSILHVEAAMNVLQRWPNAYEPILAAVAGRNKEAGSMRPRDLFATRIGQFLLTPYRGIDGQPIGPLQRAVDVFLEKRGYKIRQKVPTRSSYTARVIQRTMPCTSVARALGIRPSNAILKRVYRDTVIAFDGKANAVKGPDNLGNAVLKEVRQRLAQADDFMSPSAASEFLCHPEIATYSKLWVHPDLLQPVEADRAVFPQIKREAFRTADVLEMRKRLEAASNLVAIGAVPESFEPYGIASKAGVDAAYTGTDLLLDILAGVVPTVRTVTPARLTDLFVHTATARRRALERRVAKIIEKDQFAGTSWCEHVLSTLWPNRAEKLTIETNRELRATGAIRVQQKLNTTEGRTRPMYWYSIVDHMLRAMRDNGPSVSLDVDKQLLKVH